MSHLVGVGIDVVDVDRMAAALRRRPTLAARVFTDAERSVAGSGAAATRRLAARFAAKEAAMKSLGVGLGACRLRELEVVSLATGEPTMRLHGTAAELATRRGVASLRVSLTHTATIASAVVVAEASP